MDVIHDNTQDAQCDIAETNENVMQDCQETNTASPKCGKRRRKLTQMYGLNLKFFHWVRIRSKWLSA